MGHMGLACWRLPFLFFWFKQVQSLLLHRLSITILRDACQRPSKFQSSYTYSGKHTLPRAINKHCTSTLNPVCHQIYELWNFDYLWHPPLRITFGSLLGRFFLWEPLRQGQRSKVQSLTAKAKGWQRSACTKTRSNTLSKWWILWSTYDAFEFFFPNMLSINYFPWFFFWLLKFSGVRTGSEKLRELEELLSGTGIFSEDFSVGLGDFLELDVEGEQHPEVPQEPAPIGDQPTGGKKVKEQFPSVGGPGTCADLVAKYKRAILSRQSAWRDLHDKWVAAAPKSGLFLDCFISLTFLWMGNGFLAFFFDSRPFFLYQCSFHSGLSGLPWKQHTVTRQISCFYRVG